MDCGAGRVWFGLVCQLLPINSPFSTCFSFLFFSEGTGTIKSNSSFSMGSLRDTTALVFSEGASRPCGCFSLQHPESGHATRSGRGRLFLTCANPRRAIAKTIFNHTARAWFLPGPVHTCCFVGWGFHGPVNAFPDYFNKLFLIILPHSNLLQTIKIVPFLHSRVVPNFSKCSPR